MPLAHLPQLVQADLLECLCVERRVPFDGDLCRHAPQGVNPAAVTGADDQVGVGTKERLLHRDARAVGEHALRPAAQFLDVAEDVIPAPAVEPSGMVAQLPQDLVRLEGGEDRFDQDRRADRATRNPERILREDEDVVPQARLEMALELRQIEVGARAARGELRRGMEKGESEIEQRRRNRLPVHGQVLLDQVPPAGPHDERRGLGLERVALPLGTGVRDGAGDRVAHVLLASQVVLPRGCIGILEVRHEDVRPRVEGVDHHLALHGAGDLDAAVGQVGTDRCDRPVAIADLFRLGQEVGQPAGVELLLAFAAPRQPSLALRLEATGQRAEELERRGL